MKIYLMDVDERMTKSWSEQFAEEEDVLIFKNDFEGFIKDHAEVDFIVSAANSFGIMDGGLDAAYVKYYGRELQQAVQQKIKDEYLGEQPVGSSIMVPIPAYNEKYLIHTPTMRTPQPIIDPRVIYSCTRSTLVLAVKNNAKVVMLPAFGHMTGKVNSDIVGKLMKMAYDSVLKNNGISYDSWQEIDTSIDEVLLGHFIYM